MDLYSLGTIFFLFPIGLGLRVAFYNLAIICYYSKYFISGQKEKTSQGLRSYYYHTVRLLIATHCPFFSPKDIHSLYFFFEMCNSFRSFLSVLFSPQKINLIIVSIHLNVLIFNFNRNM